MNIVVAACKNNGIGINKLPWMLRNDLKYFKFLTDHAIHMGKNIVLVLELS